nr:hypothetical protein [Mucilaginibacter conchicola]
MLAGGFYLAYEGAEEIFSYLYHRNKDGHTAYEVSN